MLIAYHYIVLRDDGAEFSDGKTRRLGGGAGFSPPISLARAAHVACPGNLAALKPPLAQARPNHIESTITNKNH